jgi:hypothetical protein
MILQLPGVLGLAVLQWPGGLGLMILQLPGVLGLAVLHWPGGLGLMILQLPGLLGLAVLQWPGRLSCWFCRGRVGWNTWIFSGQEGWPPCWL